MVSFQVPPPGRPRPASAAPPPRALSTGARDADVSSAAEASGGGRVEVSGDEAAAGVSGGLVLCAGGLLVAAGGEMGVYGVEGAVPGVDVSGVAVPCASGLLVAARGEMGVFGDEGAVPAAGVSGFAVLHTGGLPVPAGGVRGSAGGVAGGGIRSSAGGPSPAGDPALDRAACTNGNAGGTAVPPATGDAPPSRRRGATRNLIEPEMCATRHPRQPILWISRWTARKETPSPAAPPTAAAPSSATATALPRRAARAGNRPRRATPLVNPTPIPICEPTSTDAAVAALIAPITATPVQMVPAHPRGTVPFLSSRPVDWRGKGFHRLWITSSSLCETINVGGVPRGLQDALPTILMTGKPPVFFAHSRTRRTRGLHRFPSPLRCFPILSGPPRAASRPPHRKVPARRASSSSPPFRAGNSRTTQGTHSLLCGWPRSNEGVIGAIRTGHHPVATAHTSPPGRLARRTRPGGDVRRASPRRHDPVRSR